jgi:hypothetical protein
MPFFNIPGSGSGESNSFPVLKGQGTPSDSIGADGQLFIDSLNELVYVKDGGTWGAGISLGVDEWQELQGRPTEFPPASHTHVVLDVDGLQAALNGKAAAEHGHTVAQVTGLETALAGKADAIHTHEIAAIIGLQSALNNLAAGSGGVAWSSVPASPTSTGAAGSIAYNATHFYVAVAANTWRRVGLSTWTAETPTITITQQPTNQTAADGAATFTVAATASNGSAVSFQWELSTDSGATWANVTGATAASLALTGLTETANGNQYRAVVSATGATSVPSDAATLTVGDPLPTDAVLTEAGAFLQTEAGDFLLNDGVDAPPPPAATISVTTQPENTFLSVYSVETSIAQGLTGQRPVAFAEGVASNGAAVTTQWQQSTDGGNQWANIANNNSNPSRLDIEFTPQTIRAANQNQYRAVLSADNAASATTDAMTLTTIDYTGLLTVQRSAITARVSAGEVRLSFMQNSSDGNVYPVAHYDSDSPYANRWQRLFYNASDIAAVTADIKVALPWHENIKTVNQPSNLLDAGRLLSVALNERYFSGGFADAANVTDKNISFFSIPENETGVSLIYEGGFLNPPPVLSVMMGSQIRVPYDITFSNQNQQWDSFEYSPTAPDSMTYKVERRESELSAWVEQSLGNGGLTWSSNLSGLSLTFYRGTQGVDIPYARQSDHGTQLRVTFYHQDAAPLVTFPITLEIYPYSGGMEVVSQSGDTFIGPGPFSDRTDDHAAIISATGGITTAGALNVTSRWQVATAGAEGPYSDVADSDNITFATQETQTQNSPRKIQSTLNILYENNAGPVEQDKWYRCEFSLSDGSPPVAYSDAILVRYPPD